MVVARRKKPPPALDRIRFERLEEGRCAQVLHAFIAASGAGLRGKHHEIYLSDIQKAEPAKWKTILRQPLS